ncbi:MAG: HlyD family secretion protein [Bacteroidaceae bacterium]|nr:HlyD family secretion protein [Bacteroidaceae bacterium]
MNKKSKKLIFNIVVLACLILGLTWVASRFIHLGSVEFTDNAQVKQHIVPVNSRVQGFIKEIRFEEYQEFKKGDTLAIIEDSEFRFRLAQAEADYYNAVSGKSAMATAINTTSSNIEAGDAAVAEAKVRMENAERDYIRYKNLFENDAVTKQQFDAMETNYVALKQRYEALKSQRQSTVLVKAEQGDRLNQTEAAIRLAEAALDLAKLNLSYTVIIAPCDGVTGRKKIQVGQLIQPGQTITDFVDSGSKWVIANYKETQTANISVGNEVEIEVDAVPNVVFKGIVESVSQATGASFSLLPQDNSAGNFVKIEQRIPVKIIFTDDNKADDMARLRAGMNAECIVNY